MRTGCGLLGGMSDRVSDLEVKVAELSESLRRMEGRVGLLERGLSPAAARRVRAAAAGAAAPASDAASAMLRQDAASVAGTVSLDAASCRSIAEAGCRIGRGNGLARDRCGILP